MSSAASSQPSANWKQDFCWTGFRSTVTATGLWSQILPTPHNRTRPLRLYIQVRTS